MDDNANITCAISEADSVFGIILALQPRVAAGAGVSREDSIITLARELGYEVSARRLTRDDIYVADEAFFTGTAAEVTPIRELDNRTIGDGKRGPVTTRLQQLFFDVIRGKVPKHMDWLSPVEEKSTSKSKAKA